MTRCHGKSHHTLDGLSRHGPNAASCILSHSIFSVEDILDLGARSFRSQHHLYGPSNSFTILYILSSVTASSKFKMVVYASSFLSLPAELRCMIYELVFGAKRVYQLDNTSSHRCVDAPLLRVNKSISHEAAPLFYRSLTLKILVYPFKLHTRHRQFFDSPALSRFCSSVGKSKLSYLRNIEFEIRTSFYFEYNHTAKDILTRMRMAGLTHIRCLTISKRQWAGLSPYTTAQHAQQKLAEIGRFCFDRRFAFSKLIECPIEIDKPIWPFYDFGLVDARIKVVADNVRLRAGVSCTIGGQCLEAHVDLIQESLIDVRRPLDGRESSEERLRAGLPMRYVPVRQGR